MTWWKDAVIYQIYPRSFYDSDGDGIGDLEGIIQKLDYLNGKEDSLGIDAIWISPIYPSPMFDFGYDISNYSDIDPVFGDLTTFKKLISEAHKRNIKIIMDLVLNHTSHLHPWFIESRSSKTNPKRNWYMWEDKVNGERPNNWLGIFGDEAWEWDEQTEQYYYHTFLKEQPDLNWRNPEVKEAIFNMIRFWLEMGVDGFRLDVINVLIKDKDKTNNPSEFFKGIRAYDRQIHIYDRDRPEVHDILKEFRKLLDSYSERMSVGEILLDWPGDETLPAKYYGDKSDELHLAFNFKFLYSAWDAEKFEKIINIWENALKKTDWPNYTLSNHDFQRHITRYARHFIGKEETDSRARIAALMLLTLRGTPFIYYGEELGMRGERVPLKQIMDPLGKKYWPFYPGRDVARRPMCWNTKRNAGFSEGLPWLPVNSDYKSINVETESKDPDSLLNFYKTLIKIRKQNRTLMSGDIEMFADRPKGILSYYRIYNKEKLLVILNFTNSEIEINLKENASILFSVIPREDTKFQKGKISLPGYQGLILKCN